ncbi:hypothetical protein HCH_00680 [Hahella chejuensis KCTC 2396]|uniref:Uncharacterized protein n=1 Tax=Hahella chejuensis (strain KCTC 2396) TaxID=349521 RepID=Q2SP44_HAHCH|nr:hypothetical protein [Hahella chejuensis]ABC27580.1 hypothetical protein HCH_00680 [Hahella chejuensis KCTC 2396]
MLDREADSFDLINATPGFYLIHQTKEARIAGEPAQRVRCSSVVVNGMNLGMDMVIREQLPWIGAPFNWRAQGEDVIGPDYELFYLPPFLYAKSEGKLKASQEAFIEKASALLADAIIEAQEKGQEIEWTLCGDGARLFFEALRRIDGIVLDKQYVRFIAPTQDLTTLLPLMRGLGMKLFGDVLSYHKYDFFSVGNRLFHRRKILKEIAAFGAEYEGAAFCLGLKAVRERKMVANLLIFFVFSLLFFVGYTRSSGDLSNWIILCFVMLPVLHGVWLLSEFNTLVKAIFARRIPNPDLNPHFTLCEEFDVRCSDDIRGPFKEWRSIFRARAALKKQLRAAA